MSLDTWWFRSGYRRLLAAQFKKPYPLTEREEGFLGGVPGFV
jgi:hypothetical protein